MGDARLLVMDWVRHAPVSGSDARRFVQAATWLARKDRLVHDNFQANLDAGYFTVDYDRPPFAGTVDDCIDIIRRATERIRSPLLSPAFLLRLAGRKAILYDCAASIFRTGPLTVCHRDFHLRNFLVPSTKPGARTSCTGVILRSIRCASTSHGWC